MQGLHDDNEASAHVTLISSWALVSKYTFSYVATHISSKKLSK